MYFRQVTVALIALSLSTVPPSIGASGTPVFDAANFQQNLVAAANTVKSNVNEAKALLYQVQQIAGQAQQIRMEAQNLINYPVGVYNELKYNVEFMRQLADSSADIGSKLSQLSARFSTTYPGYKTPVDYQNEYLTWTNNSLGSIKAALDTVERQVKTLDFEDKQMDKIRDQSATAVGQMQALQSANQISAEMVSQLQKLRQLQMSEMVAQNAYMSAQIQDRAAEKAAVKAWLDSAKNYKPIN